MHSTFVGSQFETLMRSLIILSEKTTESVSIGHLEHLLKTVYEKQSTLDSKKVTSSDYRLIKTPEMKKVFINIYKLLCRLTFVKCS